MVGFTVIVKVRSLAVVRSSSSGTMKMDWGAVAPAAKVMVPPKVLLASVESVRTV